MKWLVSAYSNKEDGWAWVGEADSGKEAIENAIDLTDFQLTTFDDGKMVAHYDDKLPTKDEPGWGCWDMEANKIESNGLIGNCPW